MFFTFRWSSICLRTLNISYLTHHHPPLHPQYRCYYRHIAVFGFSHSSSSSSEQLQRSVHIAACFTAVTVIRRASFLCTSELHKAVLKPWKRVRVVMTGIHSSFSIIQSYPRGDDKTGLGTQSLFQTINW